MTSRLVSLFQNVQVKMLSEDGQDLIEYALVIGVIAFGAAASINGIAAKLTAAFNTFGTRLSGYIT